MKLCAMPEIVLNAPDATTTYATASGERSSRQLRVDRHPLTAVTSAVAPAAGSSARAASRPFCGASVAARGVTSRLEDPLMSPTARRLQRDHAADLTHWFRAQRVLDANVGRLARDLETYLLRWTLQTPEEGAHFLAAVPLVLAHCDDDIYNDQVVADAYAWVHLLERYRRTWFALCALFEVGRLPLARRGLEVLDVGTGPAPVLYAVSDFHAAVRAFAEEADIEGLKLEHPHLGSVEQSGAMTHLMHVLSEIGQRPRGPFGSEFRDILEVAPEELRRRRRKFEVDRVMEEEGIGDERTANRMVSQSGYVDSSFRYRFVVFSNFLTTRDGVGRWREPLEAVARSLYPGGLTFVTGAVDGGKYREIYRDLVALMSRCGLRAVDELPAVLDSGADASGLTQVKRVWTHVWRRLTDLGVADTSVVEEWPALWHPQVAHRGKRFAIRAFRRAGAS
jgi:hypothetical protein